MIKGVEGSTERYLVDLARIQETQSRVQRDISSGVRVNRASDAPDSVINILRLRSDLERAGMIDSNMARVKSEVDTAEAAVKVAVELVERARVLAAQAATSTATNRVANGIEAEQIHDQLVALTGTTSEGRYVFSGDLESERLYAVDRTQSGGVARLHTATNTRELEDVNGSRFSVSKSAHDLFDARDAGGTPLDHNVFNAVYTLSEALKADDQTAVQAAIPKLVESLDHLNRQLTFYGHAQNRVATTTKSVKEAILARTEELSTAQDTDVAEALIRLQTSGLHLQVALGARAQMPQTTLFDFLA